MVGGLEGKFDSYAKAEFLKMAGKPIDIKEFRDEMVMHRDHFLMKYIKG